MSRFSIFISVLFLLFFSWGKAQQLTHVHPDNPFNLQDFETDFIKNHRVKTIWITQGTKVMGQKIIPQTISWKLSFNNLGQLTKKVKLIKGNTNPIDSVETFFYYQNGQLEEEVISSSFSVESIQYITEENGKSQVTRTKRSRLGELKSEHRINYEKTTPKADLILTKQLNNGKPTLLLYEYLNPDGTLRERQKIQQPQGYKTTDSFTYNKTKLEKISIREFGTETEYLLQYNTEKLLSRVSCVRNQKEQQALEYFYFKGMLESALLLKTDSKTVEITNYSYEYY